MKTSSLIIVLFFLFTASSFAQDDNDLKELQSVILLEKPYINIKIKISELENYIKIKKDKQDSIIKNQQTQIKNLESDLQKISSENIDKIQEAERRVKDQLLDKISLNYLSNNNFDDLINSSNIQTLRNDRDLLGTKLLTNKRLKQKFDDLEVYFTSKD